MTSSLVRKKQFSVDSASAQKKMVAVPCWKDSALHSRQPEGSTILLFLRAFRSAILKEEHRQASSVHPWYPPHTFATPLSKKRIEHSTSLFRMQTNSNELMPFVTVTIHLCVVLSMCLSVYMHTYLILVPTYLHISNPEKSFFLEI